ncbi:MAG: hypothetical protein M1321_00105 [Candidatus Marsarchaeota archaeon]|nr:hypothetical protein [Candidatus Marsarchaeota archaeon]
MGFIRGETPYLYEYYPTPSRIASNYPIKASRRGRQLRPQEIYSWLLQQQFKRVETSLLKVARLRFRCKMQAKKIILIVTSIKAIATTLLST